MTVDEVYSLMKYIINKNMQGFLKPVEFNRTINAAQAQYQSFLLGSFQTYSTGRPIAKVELGQNSVVRQRLSPTIYGYILNINPYGQSPYPDDYIQADAMWSIYGAAIYSHKRIRNVQQNYLDAYYNSVIDPIASNPIYLITDTGFQFYPENQYTARLHYVRNAPDIVWGYTEDGNGRPIYNPATSVDPIWDNAAIFDIITRALIMVGVNLQAPAVMQYANEIKQTGQ
jgi:hypothetical protein